MKRAIATTALLALALLVLAGAAEAKLKPVGGLHVSKVSPSSITLRWKDRSKGEKSYSVSAENEGDGAATITGHGNAEKAKLKKLKPGTVYTYEVRACAKGGKCGAARGGRRARERCSSIALRRAIASTQARGLAPSKRS